jgi:hypothetical protein
LLLPRRSIRYLRRRILKGLDLECAKERGQIDHVVRG